ncbi:hypothetical protein H0H87_005752 [Tephrocybe sp. NHM501043]|nr:hypothetical protein H0H87_005752 [Tephrocybe sp. NHM501043]
MAERQQILLDNGGYRDFEVSLDKSLQYMGESAVSFEKDFSTSFTGRSISIYGVFWTHSVSTFQVTLDSGNPTDIINYRQGFTVNMTYSSPFLEDSMHTIKVSGLAMAYVDYMTVEMGKNPPLVRKTLIVDEGDSSITYSNETNWTRNSPIIVSRSNGVFSARLPYGGSTLDTTTFGSSATFTFTGDSVSVYGAPPEDNIGNIEFTLDGITSNRSFNETSGSPMHYPLFLSSSLPLGGHTLTVKYLEGPGALRLDYFLYTPNGHIQTGSTPSQKEGLSAGAIIGIVVGVGGFVAVLGAILFWLRRRRRQQGMHARLRRKLDASLITILVIVALQFQQSIAPRIAPFQVMYLKP